MEDRRQCDTYIKNYKKACGNLKYDLRTIVKIDSKNLTAYLHALTTYVTDMMRQPSRDNLENLKGILFELGPCAENRVLYQQRCIPDAYINWPITKSHAHAAEEFEQQRKALVVYIEEMEDILDSWPREETNVKVHIVENDEEEKGKEVREPLPLDIEEIVNDMKNSSVCEDYEEKDHAPENEGKAEESMELLQKLREQRQIAAIEAFGKDMEAGDDFIQSKDLEFPIFREIEQTFRATSVHFANALTLANDETCEDGEEGDNMVVLHFFQHRRTKQAPQMKLRQLSQIVQLFKKEYAALMYFIGVWSTFALYGDAEGDHSLENQISIMQSINEFPNLRQVLCTRGGHNFFAELMIRKADESTIQKLAGFATLDPFVFCLTSKFSSPRKMGEYTLVCSELFDMAEKYSPEQFGFVYTFLVQYIRKYTARQQIVPDIAEEVEQIRNNFVAKVQKGLLLAIPHLTKKVLPSLATQPVPFGENEEITLVVSDQLGVSLQIPTVTGHTSVFPEYYRMFESTRGFVHSGKSHRAKFELRSCEQEPYLNLSKGGTPLKLVENIGMYEMFFT